MSAVISSSAVLFSLYGLKFATSISLGNPSISFTLSSLNWVSATTVVIGVTTVYVAGALRIKFSMAFPVTVSIVPEEKVVLPIISPTLIEFITTFKLSLIVLLRLIVADPFASVIAISSPIVKIPSLFLSTKANAF